MCQVGEVSGHLFVKVRGINVVSDTGTRRKRGNIDTSNFYRQMTTHFSHLTQALVDLSVKVRGIDVASLSTSACVK
jgi:hypothetical protein